MFTFCHVCQPSLNVGGLLLMTRNMFCCICGINIPLQPKMSCGTYIRVYIVVLYVAQTGLSRTHPSK
ncbi:LOW QUALITY PROTEIN: uncharacterized protein LOC122320027 [Drosophila ficusphila]|uniref:LOW QUALITY PROTEIN: uncharacterized protein LOC122320027 n=1 Tax=Drosophila ficusphila TaxID=30025 RepID=UPI001C8987BA|nr:LOW QUALITY PROTEIN: uncharacterized protein LOC122320027 [Drosophila ficusphila]